MNALLALTLWFGCGGPDSEYLPPEGTTALPEERIAGAAGEASTSAPPDATPENTPDLPDKDGDGFGPLEDCDDANATVNVAMEERCDGLDNNCNGEIDEASDCPCDVSHRDGRAYQFCGNLATDWNSARLHCEQSGYTLVQIDDAEEDAWLVTQAAHFRTPFVWIGLNDKKTEGTWAWVNGDPAPFQTWNVGEPNNWSGREDCGILYVSTEKAGKWNDRNCADARPQFICEAG